MKNILKILVLLLFVIVTHSCYEDESTLDVNTIQGVEIDTTGLSSLSVYQFDKLNIEPKLNYDGLSDNQLSFEWKINIEPNDTIYQVLSDTRNLDSEIAFPPTFPGYTHQLVYTVTDVDTDIDYIMSWPVTVLNNIGEGIVIAETADGLTTDISHIMSADVTTDFDGESVKYQVYSKINGTTIPGITKQLKYYQIYGKNAVLGITDDLIYKIDPLDFTLAETNDDLFYVAKSNYSPQALGQVYQGSLFINSGNLTSTYFGASQKFGVPFSSDYEVPSIIASNPQYGPDIVINFYDEVNDQFVYQTSISSFGDTNMYPVPASDGAFNPASLPNKVNMAAIASTSGEFRYVLKDELTGVVGLYLFDGGGYVYPEGIPPSPIAFHDLTNAPDMAEAKSFVFLDDQKVLYYATDSKIYAVIYATSTPVVQERYTFDAGEELSLMQVYQQADYPSRSSGDYLPLNNKALLVATFDGTEGKVHLLPFINAGVGNIDTPNIKTFTGFNRITAMGTQL